MSTHDPTRARVLHWFVRGGTATGPDGKSVAVDVDPVVIGRDEGAAIRVSDPEVSAFHCELRGTNEGVLVKDLGSTNGTFVGGAAVETEVALSDGDLVQVGTVDLTVRLSATDKLPATKRIGRRAT
jgi:pSer/pThr/pTyr-binding forkhead associated (FHA) protein